MAPPIHYALTSDGIRIAFWAFGEGPTLVYMPPIPFSDIRREWLDPDRRLGYQRLARGRTVVRYDCRGSGSSDHEALDFSLEAQVRDVEAVVAEMGVERFALMGVAFSGPVAITYAIRHPEAVTHLILAHTAAKGSDLTSSVQAEAIFGLIDKDWELFTETFAHARLGWTDGEIAGRLAAFIREAVTPGELGNWLTYLREYDVTPILENVKVPTLVLEQTGHSFAQVEAARFLASRVPGAHLELVEPGPSASFARRTESSIVEIEEFFAETEPPPGEQQSTPREQPAGQSLNPENLTPREVDVLRLLAAGQSNKEIAGELGLSVHTVERHLENAYRKIGARGRADATAYVVKQGIG